MFQYYILANMMNPGLFGQLSPNVDGKTEPYKVILMHFGGSQTYTLMFPETGEAYTLTGMTTATVTMMYKCFDLKTMLYLYEPTIDKVQEPVLPASLRSPSYIATVSPDNKRYKETAKRLDCRVLYFPLWNLEDILAIARYLREHDPGYQGARTDDEVRARVAKFGQVLRPVLASKGWVKQYEAGWDSALAAADATALLLRGNIEDHSVSDFVAQMVVPTEGENALTEFHLQITSDIAREKLKDKLHNVNLATKKAALKKNLQFDSHMSKECPGLFKFVTASLIARNELNGWKSQDMLVKGSALVPYKMERFTAALEEGRIPQYSEMQPGMLYVSLNNNERVVESMGRASDGSVVIYQNIWRKQTNVDITGKSLEKVCQQYGVPQGTSIEYQLLVKPTIFASTHVQFIPDRSFADCYKFSIHKVLCSL